MINISKISSNSLFKATQEQLSSEIGGEAVILNLSFGIYYGLNETGTMIW